MELCYWHDFEDGEAAGKAAQKAVYERYGPTSCVETKSSASAGDDGDFSLETEDVAKVLELDVDFGGHDDLMDRLMRGTEDVVDVLGEV